MLYLRPCLQSDCLAIQILGQSDSFATQILGQSDIFTTQILIDPLIKRNLFLWIILGMLQAFLQQYIYTIHFKGAQLQTNTKCYIYNSNKLVCYRVSQICLKDHCFSKITSIYDTDKNIVSER